MLLLYVHHTDSPRVDSASEYNMNRHLKLAKSLNPID